MLKLLRQRNFVLLWTAQIISRLGDWLLLVTLPFFVFELTKSTLATGIMFIVETIPVILLGSFAGVFVDRWERRKTMYIVALLQGLLLLELLFVRDASLVWIVYLFGFLNSAVAQFFAPAELALIPTLVPDDDLIEANALSSTSNQLASIVGPAIAGVIMSFTGIANSIIIDMITFLLAAYCIFMIRIPRKTGTESAHAEAATKQETTLMTKSLVTGLTTLVQEWRSGLSIVGKSRLLTILFIVAPVVMLGQGMLNVIRVPFTIRDMGGNVVMLGWLAAAQSIGSLISNLFMKRISQLIKPYLLISLSLIIIGLLLAISANSKILWLYITFSGFIGVPVIIQYITMINLLQKSVDNKFQGRIFGAIDALTSLALLVGMSLASLTSDQTGGLLYMNIVSFCYFLGGIVAFSLIKAGPLATTTTKDVPTVQDIEDITAPISSYDTVAREEITHES